ncbi:MICAL-like protein 2 [Callorhinchus milii]|uniref:MICAL-like protein 2 n=1 Tax=Callorhinchus milii TaxID=7868 RepID=UPI001C3FF01E|nr:MICAL-like protein 2 [Callorhinchus milii]
MAAIKALQLWCKKQCEGYSGVQITNMTSSWRDGLAFCAIIHHFRPDLINFDSLKKENVYENNKMAFQLAEEMLGIPALLDAEDMVALRVPDRLSILTYVSQYHNYFTGRSPIGGLACIKRPASEPSEEPVQKKATPETKPKLPKNLPVSPAGPGAKSPLSSKQEVVSAGDRSISSNCALCRKSVLLVQRYLVDGSLYHRNCFRCKQCSNVLMAGAYKPGPEPGTFICINHQSRAGGRETGNPPPRPGWAPGPRESATGPTVNRPVTGQINRPTIPAQASGTPKIRPAVSKPETPTGAGAERTWAAKQKFLVAETPGKLSPSPSSCVTPSGPRTGRGSHSPPAAQRGGGLGSDTASPKTPQGTEPDKEKARGFLLRTLSDVHPSRLRAERVNTPLPNTTKTPTDPLPPGKLPWTRPASSLVPEPEPRVPKTPRAEEARTPARTQLNRTASVTDSRQGKGSSMCSPLPSPGGNETESPSDWRSRLKPVQKNRSFSSVDVQISSSGRMDVKKPEAAVTKPAVVSPPERSTTVNIPGRRVPPVPIVNPLPKPSVGTPGKELEITFTIQAGSVSPSSDKPAQKKRTVLTPDASLRDEAKGSLLSPSGADEEESGKMSPALGGSYSPALDRIKKELPGKKSWVQGNMARDRFFADMQPPSEDKAGQLTPASPDMNSHQAQTRPGYIPEEQIQKELGELGSQLDQLEHRGVELEPQLRSCEGDEREDELMADWFKLIHEKQLLLRRESELVYTSKQQILEVRQSDIDRELRLLMEKADETKTEADQAREKELVEELIKTVEDRNNIIDRLDEDRLREKEEDQMMEAMIQRMDGTKDAEQPKKTKNKFSPMKILKGLGIKAKGKE